MARYNGLIIPRSYNDYFSRSDPQAIRDLVALAADEELNAESKNPLQNQAIAKIVPVTASPDNKLIVQSQISGLTSDVETIKNIIPNTASETNELADKNFVNSTVGTNTANYIYKTESGGEKVPFSSVAELEAYAGTVTNNDYAFVTGIDENGNTYYDRYKADVNDGVVTWAKEYRLNNSSFTAEQWAAIQSGITAEKIEQIAENTNEIQNIKDIIQTLSLAAYPIGTLYWTTSSTFNPNTEWGGTWVRIKDKFIYAGGDNDTIGATGGSKKISVANLPSHNHNFTGTEATTIKTVTDASGSNTAKTLTGKFSGGKTDSQGENAPDYNKTNGIITLDGHANCYQGSSGPMSLFSIDANHQHRFTPSGTIGNTGSGTDYMPPYEVAYCWKRTA